MGIETRTITGKVKCTCFIVPLDEGKEHICFRKSVVGALSDEQMLRMCTQKSMRGQSDGGEANDDKESREIKNLIRTMKNFTEGVERAKVVYAESGARDIPAWRIAVGKEVRSVVRERMKGKEVIPVVESPQVPSAEG